MTLKQTFKLSASALKLMEECPRCFWLHHHDKKRPSGIFPSLPNGMDAASCSAGRNGSTSGQTSVSARELQGSTSVSAKRSESEGPRPPRHLTTRSNVRISRPLGSPYAVGSRRTHTSARGDGSRLRECSGHTPLARHRRPEPRVTPPPGSDLVGCGGPGRDTIALPAWPGDAGA